jgi:hypothetical protein
MNVCVCVCVCVRRISFDIAAAKERIECLKYSLLLLLIPPAHGTSRGQHLAPLGASQLEHLAPRCGGFARPKPARARAFTTRTAQRAPERFTTSHDHERPAPWRLARRERARGQPPRRRRHGCAERQRRRARARQTRGRRRQRRRHGGHGERRHDDAYFVSTLARASINVARAGVVPIVGRRPSSSSVETPSSMAIGSRRRPWVGWGVRIPGPHRSMCVVVAWTIPPRRYRVLSAYMTTRCEGAMHVKGMY